MPYLHEAAFPYNYLKSVAQFNITVAEVVDGELSCDVEDLTELTKSTGFIFL